MLKIADREEIGWLDKYSIDDFPCEDLRIIDQLWVKYSKGKFGFSIQKEIYESLGGTRYNFNEDLWNNFCNYVGWRSMGKSLYYDEFKKNMDLNSPPEANFPRGGACLPLVRNIGGDVVFGRAVLFSRAKACKL